MKKLIFTALIALLFYPQIAFTKIDMKFVESELLFEGRKRIAKLTLINRGDEAGSAEIIFKKEKFDENGDFQTVDVDEEGMDYYPFNINIAKYLKISPRRITLEPGAKQSFRVFFKKPKDFPEGEFRLKAFVKQKKLVKEELDIAEPDPDKFGAGVTLNVNYGIPVYIANGKLTAAITKVEELQLSSIDDADSDKKLISSIIQRTGNATLSGFIQFINLGDKRNPIYHQMTFRIPPELQKLNYSRTFIPERSFENIKPKRLAVRITDKTKQLTLYQQIIN